MPEDTPLKPWGNIHSPKPTPNKWEAIGDDFEAQMFNILKIRDNKGIEEAIIAHAKAINTLGGQELWNKMFEEGLLREPEDSENITKARASFLYLLKAPKTKVEELIAMQHDLLIGSRDLELILYYNKYTLGSQSKITIAEADEILRPYEGLIGTSKEVDSIIESIRGLLNNMKIMIRTYTCK